MRLWSLHPKYLDARGLVALWREALLAQAVLRGETRGYTHHPQLTRFREASSPLEAIAFYLQEIHAEATRRGYHFDESKIGQYDTVDQIVVTRGQIDYEWTHLKEKLSLRDPARFVQLQYLPQPQPHPLFCIVAGPIAEWEVGGATRNR